jgi:hypothetical protein
MQGGTGHPVNRVVDKNRILGKKESQGGGKVKGVADLKKVLLATHTVAYFLIASTQPIPGGIRSHDP